MTSIMDHLEAFATKETSMTRHKEGRFWQMEYEDSKGGTSLDWIPERSVGLVGICSIIHRYSHQ